MKEINIGGIKIQTYAYYESSKTMYADAYIPGFGSITGVVIHVQEDENDGVKVLSIAFPVLSHDIIFTKEEVNCIGTKQ